MNVNTKTKKGITLIELCVVLSIILIVISVIYPFFISNMKTLYETEIKSDLQREGQYAIKFLTNKAMEAQEIEAVDKGISSENDYIKLDSSTTNSAIEFTAPDSNVTPSSAINYYFMFKDESLYYQQKLSDAVLDPSKNEKIADNIKLIEVQTIDGKKFSECKGLNIKITLAKHQVKSYVIESQVYFRNKPNN